MRSSAVNFFQHQGFSELFFPLGQPSSFRRWKKLVSLFEGLFVPTLLLRLMSKCCLPEETSSIHNIVFRVLSRNEIASMRSMGGLKQVGHGKWVHPVTTVFLRGKERGMRWWCWISRENYQDGEMVWELTGKKASLLGAVVSGNPNPLQNLLKNRSRQPHMSLRGTLLSEVGIWILLFATHSSRLVHALNLSVF